ncbi:MAG: hypothetical protein MI748_00165 [Opitutales bacterium]|nr:hypothetical protein [Opitutales bacterium]
MFIWFFETQPRNTISEGYRNGYLYDLFALNLDDASKGRLTFTSGAFVEHLDWRIKEAKVIFISEDGKTYVGKCEVNSYQYNQGSLGYHLQILNPLPWGKYTLRMTVVNEKEGLEKALSAN